MSDTAINLSGRASALLLLSMLSACDWVDSTGVQGVETDTTLRNAQPVALVETMAMTASLAGEGAHLTGWQWHRRDVDERERCADIDGFDTELAAGSLEQACAIGSVCTLALDESSSDTEATRFTLQLPALRAPVALSYQLSTTRDDGAIVERQQLLCALAINEAPTGMDDHFRVGLGETLIIEADSPQSLLSNDSDDDDVRNRPLRVQSIEEQPRHAARFSVDELGGLVYQADEAVKLGEDGSLEDRFTYVLTDGLHVSRATATLRISEANEPPRQHTAIPLLTFDVTNPGAAGSTGAQQHDLSAYFSDPDGDVLTLSIQPDLLPDSGTLTLDTDGRLHGSPTAEDAGRYISELQVSDGIASISVRVDILINAPIANREPIAEDIDNRIVRNRFSYNTSRFFSDADGDTLRYSATGLPPGITISESGVISGTASRQNRGRWRIRVTADDGRGGQVSDAFQLDIR